MLPDEHVKNVLRSWLDTGWILRRKTYSKRYSFLER